MESLKRPLTGADSNSGFAETPMTPATLADVQSYSYSNPPPAHDLVSLGGDHGKKFVQLSPTCAVEVEIVFDKPYCFWQPPEVRQTWNEKELYGEVRRAGGLEQSDRSTLPFPPPNTHSSRFTPPSPWQFEVSATWDELFYDLVIVASIGQIAER